MEHRINLIQYRGILIIIKRPIYPSINQRTKVPKSFSESILIFRFLEKFWKMTLELWFSGWQELINKNIII